MKVSKFVENLLGDSMNPKEVIQSLDALNDADIICIVRASSGRRFSLAISGWIGEYEREDVAEKNFSATLEEAVGLLQEFWKQNFLEKEKDGNLFVPDGEGNWKPMVTFWEIFKLPEGALYGGSYLQFIIRDELEDITLLEAEVLGRDHGRCTISASTRLTPFGYKG